jgi:hypothetical protein
LKSTHNIDPSKNTEQGNTINNFFGTPANTSSTTASLAKKNSAGTAKIVDECTKRFLPLNMGFEKLFQEVLKLDSTTYDMELIESDILAKKYDAKLKEVVRCLSNVQTINLCIDRWIFRKERALLRLLQYFWTRTGI